VCSGDWQGGGVRGGLVRFVGVGGVGWFWGGRGGGGGGGGGELA